MHRASIVRSSAAALVLFSVAAVGLDRLTGGASLPIASAAAGDPVLQDAWPGVTFEKPICVAAPSDGSDRMFVVQRAGKILMLKKWRGTGPVAAPKTVLDLAPVLTEATYEMGQGGLLSLAFAADFATSKRFFVFYGTGSAEANNPYRAVVASYRMSAADPDVADPASAVEILSVRKNAAAHFGGGLRVGPDGHLYVGLGEAGMKDDPEKLAQDLKQLQGKVLRLDVSAPTAAAPYKIPADNPFASGAGGARREIFAYGLRNPWRISFDRETKVLWLGDPGQRTREEIDAVPAGGNMGWALFEGDKVLTPGGDPAQCVPPVFAYGREMGNCVIGGVVYRGKRFPSLVGTYVFVDNAKPKLFGMPVAGMRSTGAPKPLLDTPEGIVSIDEDPTGELYFCNLDAEKVLTMVPGQ